MGNFHSTEQSDEMVHIMSSDARKVSGFENMTKILLIRKRKGKENPERDN